MTENSKNLPKTTSAFLQNQQNLQLTSRQIEALLHASDAPLTEAFLKKQLSLTNLQLEQALSLLQERLSQGSLTLNKTASGYRLQIADHFSPLIQRVFPQRQERLSQALLETLSIIAYKQPVTRGDIEQIRGVTLSSQILRQLFDKGWIKESGFKDTLGRPALLHTTPLFLDVFGLSSLDELPELPNIQALAEFNH
ncbi:SMC-Scp complex subunit ScpB [Psychrobacter ciconiae]|uniref:SMC-Scp complex subunit ScpB n=1 Tax=Psychrobacter ciconiae TaxID=1553449 RepID=UPI0019197503|nr:SMC-Scp complex subunit ScpB [Psychrobacter ciconiae]